MSEPFPRPRLGVGAFPQRRYPKAPIIEAIISLNVEMPPGFDVKQFRQIISGPETGYTEHGEERMAAFTASPLTGVSAQEPVITGFRFISGDGKYVLGCRTSSFSLSRLAPYENWELFRDEARSLWAVFRDKFMPTKVTSLSVRYINRIEIPWKIGQQIDFKWYFRTFPEVSSDLDVGMDGFIMRLDIPLGEIGARLILNQARLPPASPIPESLSVLLDSDIVTGLEVSDESAIWERCEILRQAKNNIFEACITNLTRELFE